MAKLTIAQPETPTAPHVARIVCRVCEAVTQVSVGHPAILCFDCADDIDATEAHVQEVWAAAERAFVEAYTQLTSLINAADLSTQARYEQVRTALHACHYMPSVDLQERLRRTIALNDALSPL